MSLRDQLTALANSFAEQVLDALKSASLFELTGGDGEDAKPAPARISAANTDRAAPPRSKSKPKAKAEGRLSRRTVEQIRELAEKIQALLAKNKEGLRSEQIREALDLETREMPRVMKLGQEEGLFCILSGEKRGTIYGAGMSPAKRASSPKAPKASKVKKASKAQSKKTQAKKTAKRAAAKPAKAAKKTARPKGVKKRSAKAKAAAPPAAEAAQ